MYSNVERKNEQQSFIIVSNWFHDLKEEETVGNERSFMFLKN